MSEESEIIEIVDGISDASDKILLIGFPDVGLVGAIAVSFLIDKLRLKDIGYISSEELPPIVAIHGNSVKELIRIHEGEKIITLFSEIPIPVHLVKPLSRTIIDWCKRKGIKTIISLTGLAEPRRIDIEKPKIYVIGSNIGLSDRLSALVEAEKFKDGYITGINAELLREGVKAGSDVGVILAQSHYNYPDPGAAAELIKHLPKIIGEEVDVNPLLESAEMVRMQMRDLMRRTSEAMGAMQKSKELELPPVYM